MLAFLFYVQGNCGISARQQFGVLPWLRPPLCGWPGGRYAAIAGANSGDVQEVLYPWLRLLHCGWPGRRYAAIAQSGLRAVKARIEAAMAIQWSD